MPIRPAPACSRSIWSSSPRRRNNLDSPNRDEELSAVASPYMGVSGAQVETPVSPISAAERGDPEDDAVVVVGDEEPSVGREIERGGSSVLVGAVVPPVRKVMHAAAVDF